MDASALKSFFEVDGKSQVLLNPRRSTQEKKWVENAQLPSWPSHLWISSSGTTAVGEIKLIGLSRQAFLTAAEGANQFLQVTGQDSWLNVLPLFHVGGLAIYARAFLSKSKVIDISHQANGEPYKWNPAILIEEIKRNKITLLSLVPTQVFDLVRAGVKAPESLRIVLVGGGLLQNHLYREARLLGWPLLPTYGMSELCSQVATVSPLSLKEKSASIDTVPSAELLPHIHARTTETHRLELKSQALFSGYVYVGEKGSRVEEHKKDSWFLTSDFAELDGRNLTFKGRVQDQIKVGGELVNLSRLQNLFQTLIQDAKFVVLSESDSRLESRVVVVFEGVAPTLAETYVDLLNNNVAPYERIQALYIVDQMPRTDLGKIKTAELKNQLGL